MHKVDATLGGLQLVFALIIFDMGSGGNGRSSLKLL